MAHPGTAHTYSKKLIAFEHVSSASSSTTNEATNTLLWIGGLGDGLLTVQYPAQIAASLPPDWRLAEVLIKSSYNGWATGSLGRDARELGQCVAYFKELRKEGTVVLMGHSTGCQDIMEYLIGADAHERPMIEGAILQGGVSDREAWADMLKTDEEKKQLEEIVAAAKRMIDDGDEKSILQMEDNVVAKELGAPISAYRTYSLLAKGGDDDYFSTDLSDEHFCTTFGEIPKATKVCFLLGGEDPYVPASIDRAALLQRWTRIIREGGGSVDDTNGGVVLGAHHNLNGDPEEVVQDLVKRVVGFVENVETLEKRLTTHPMPSLKPIPSTNSTNGQDSDTQTPPTPDESGPAEKKVSGKKKRRKRGLKKKNRNMDSVMEAMVDDLVASDEDEDTVPEGRIEMVELTPTSPVMVEYFNGHQASKELSYLASMESRIFSARVSHPDKPGLVAGQEEVPSELKGKHRGGRKKRSRKVKCAKADEALSESADDRRASPGGILRGQGIGATAILRDADGGMESSNASWSFGYWEW